MQENPEKFKSNQEEIGKQNAEKEEAKKADATPVVNAEEGGEDAPSVHSSQKQDQPK